MAAEEQTVNRIGVGVDLFGGTDTLTNLRAIRQEMLVIRELAQSTKIPGQISGLPSGNPNQRSLFDQQERLFKDSEERQTRTQREELSKRQKDFQNANSQILREKRRFEQEMAKASSPVSESEVQLETKKRGRRKTLNEEVIKETEEQQAKRRGAIVKVLQDQARLDKQERDQIEESTNLFKQACERQIQVRSEMEKKLEAQAARSQAASQRMSTRPRNAQGQFLSNDEIKDLELQQSKKQRILELNQRINERGEAERLRKEREANAKLRSERQAEQMNEARLDAIVPNRESQIANQARLRDRKAANDAAKEVDKARRPATSFPGYVDVDETTKAINKVQDASQKMRRELSGRNIQFFDKDTKIEARAIYSELNRVGIRAEELKAELGSVNFTRPRIEIINDLKAIEREQQVLVERTRQLKESQLRVGATGGPSRGPNLNDPQGLINEKGFFTTGDALGRITRNILLYEVVSRASYGLVDYIGKSITAAKTTVEFANALRFATESANGNLQANENLVEQIRPLGLSRQQSRSAVTEAARFTESRPQDINQLTTIVADIAAERGGGIDKADSLIEQLRRRESKFYKRIFGKTVESIYEDEARQNVRTRQTDADSTVIGKDTRNFKTEEEKVKAYVAAMDDAAKENAVLNYILSQGSRFQGEAAERANTLAGRLDKIAAASLDAQENIGLFITEIKPLNDILTSIASKSGILDTLRPPQIGRSGPGGTITEADLQQYGIDRTTGGRAAALNNLDQYGAVEGLGLLGVGALGLIGRKQATQTYRQGIYDRALPGLEERLGDTGAASAEARTLAMQGKPGFLRSVRAGVNRVTLGLTESVLDLTSSAAQTIGAETLAAKVKLRSQMLSSPGSLANIASGGSPSTGSIPNIYGIPSVSRDPATGRFIPYTGQSRDQIRDYFTNNYGSYYGSSVSIRSGRENITARSPLYDLDQVSDRNRKYFEKRNDDISAKIDRAGQVGGNVGGLIGGIAGAEVGYFVAKSMNAGSITTSVLTVVGGVVGSAVGTAVGAAGGAAIAGAATAAGGYGALASTVASQVPIIVPAVVAAIGLLGGYAIGSTINTVFDPFGKNKQEAKDLAGLRREEAIAGAYPQQVKEIRKAQEEGRFFFRSTRQEDKYTTHYTPAEVRDRVAQGLGTLADYKYEIEDTGPVSKYEQRQRQNKAELEKLKQDTNFKPSQWQLNALQARQENQEASPEMARIRDEARTRFEESTQKILIEEDRKAAELARKRDTMVQQQTNALSKLRDAAQGSFRIVGDVANSITGPENPFTAALSDAATLGERMQQQWGFAGKAAVEYFSQVEQRRISLQLVKADFDNLAQSQNLFNRAAKERDERGGPGYSTRQTQGLSIANAVIDQVNVEAQANKRLAELFPSGFLEYTQGSTHIGDGQERAGERKSFDLFRASNGFNADFFKDIVPRAKDQISSLQQRGTSLGLGFGADYGQLSETIANATGSVLENLDPRQVRNDPYLRSVAVRNIGIQRQAARKRLDDEIQKAALNQNEEGRLRNDLSQAAARRDQLISQGKSPRDVGQAYDRFVIGRTEGIPVKDLTFEEFEQRNSATRREAERTVAQQAEARAAILKGLEYQQLQLGELRIIREKIIGGDFSMLLQVQNDTQARLDQEALQDSNPNFAVPLDQGQVKVNPYTAATQIYGAGAGAAGRKR